MRLFLHPEPNEKINPAIKKIIYLTTAPTMNRVKPEEKEILSRIEMGLNQNIVK